MATKSTPSTKLTNKEKKTAKRAYLFAVGRRKKAVACVRLYEQIQDGLVFESYSVRKGDIVVNGKAIAQYFPGEAARQGYLQPLRITNAQQNNYTFTIKVMGGGPSGQLQAVISGIANSLNKLNREKYRLILKRKGFLTRDARVRERRSVGTGGKARRVKQSPKR